MKILLVEDSTEDQQLTCSALAHLDHQVLLASNGAKALEMFRHERPDVVITGIYMPGMDGFALTRAVQNLALPHWQPVIFLSNQSDDALQRKALETGAEAFIVKPVQTSALEGRLLVIERLLRMQRDAWRRRSELERYYAAEEEDKRIARHLIGRLMTPEQLGDPAIRHWLMPSPNIGGDLIGCARTPNGILHAMIADGSGHGLAASINALPVAAPFYRMTEKGFGIETIVRELNAKVRQFLPADRFVAVTLAAIDFREGLVKVWNGGNPEPFLLSADGHAEKVFLLGHVPLGALPDEEFDASIETHALSKASQLVLHTDGLIKALNRQGEMFGIHRLAAALAHADADQRLPAVIEAVSNHLDGQMAQDDISVLLINCLHDKGALEPPPERLRVGSSDLGEWQFSLHLGPNELRRVDVVPLLLGLVNQFEGSRVRSGEVFIVLAELFNNALDHGLLRLDSRLKSAPEGMETYLAERSQRLAALSEGEIEITFQQTVSDGRAWLRVRCRDSGPGFDYRQFERPMPTSTDGRPFGRGLQLVRSLCAQLEFKNQGSDITAIIALES